MLITMELDVHQVDITTLAVDAIVNAANATLLGGGGVDGAIHHEAGPRLLEACRALPEIRPGVRCPTGEARITPGFDLPARYVIHTVGPVWRGGGNDEAGLLASCYRNSLQLALDRDLDSIAFPAISCGAYGYPIPDATRVAVDSLRTTGADRSIRVLLCSVGEAVDAAWRAALQR
jgi:O-acetyl-ADP-ribose deacetylase (regulator of RNase III)